MVRALRALPLVAALAAGGCGGDDEPARPGPRAQGPAAVVWAVGDAATAQLPGRRLAKMIVESRFDRLLYLGDVYENGTLGEFRRWYEPLYGSVADRTAPIAGNHEYPSRRRGYVPYWRSKLGRAPRPWYAIRVGGWEVLALNTEAPHDARSPQVRWLRARLRAGRGTCRMALLHRPRFSAGRHGDQADVAPLWDALRGRAVAVVSGHDHNLQRFRRSDEGLVQFVSGAGGRGLYEVDPEDPRLAFADDERLGALRLELREGSARFAFVADDGEVLDRGELRCRP
jgi:hypothetical protein